MSDDVWDMTAVTKELERPFSPDEIEHRTVARGQTKPYLTGATVIRRLNRATGNQWDLEVLDLEERMMFGKQLLVARVALTIPGLGRRCHLGVQRIDDGGGEDLLKGAVTDALKKAATLFGLGLDLDGVEDYPGDVPQNTAPGNQRGPVTRQTAPGGTGRPATQPRPAAASFGWSEFWPWARGAGMQDKAAVERVLGEPMDGMNPAQLKAMIEGKL